MWRQAVMVLKEEDHLPLSPPVPVMHADGVESALIHLTRRFVVNAGTQTLNLSCGIAKDVPHIVLEATQATLSSQVNVASLRSVNDAQDLGGNAELVHHNLAVYLSTRSRPPGLQWQTKKDGSSEPMMKCQKYLRQTCSLEAARILHLPRRHVKTQRNQYPGSLLGPLVMLEHHGNLVRRWRNRARPQHARRTGAALTSSQYFEGSAQPMRLVSAAYSDACTSGGGTQEPPRCSGR